MDLSQRCTSLGDNIFQRSRPPSVRVEKCFVCLYFLFSAVFKVALEKTVEARTSKVKSASDADEMELLSHIINRRGDASGADNFVLNLFAGDLDDTSPTFTSDSDDVAAAAVAGKLSGARRHTDEPPASVSAVAASSAAVTCSKSGGATRTQKQRTLADAVQEVR